MIGIMVKKKLQREIMERLLQSITEKMPAAQAGDWLESHKETGQRFSDYKTKLDERRKYQSNNNNHSNNNGGNNGIIEEKTIYICLMGDFTKEQLKVLDITLDYLAVFYNTECVRKRIVSLQETEELVPDNAKRTQKGRKNRQFLTSYILDNILQPDRPDDALAYLAFTSFDLYPDPEWNYVFGQASLVMKLGVWSIYRNGDPAKHFKACLRRTMATASHESGHIICIKHCIYYNCNMNGSNSGPESDRRPMNFCPVCLQKLLYFFNLTTKEDAIKYLQGIADFCGNEENKEYVDDLHQWATNAVSLLNNHSGRYSITR